MNRRRLLQFDHVKLVGGLERWRQSLRERVVTIDHLDAEFPYGWMVEEKAAQGRVMAALDHHAAFAGFGHRHGAPAAGAVKREPMSAAFEPTLDELALLIVEMGPGHIGDEKAAPRQPFGNVGEIVADGRGQSRRFLEQL